MERFIEVLRTIERFFVNWYVGLTANIAPATVNIILAVIGAALLIIILKIIMSAGYQKQYKILKLRIKNIEKSKITEDVVVTPQDEKDEKKTEKEEYRLEKKARKYGIIDKTMEDYASLLEKGVISVDTRALTEKYVNRMSFLGWAYPSIERFVSGMEIGIVFAGVLFTMFFPDKSLYVTLTLTSYTLLKILGSIFDYKLVKDRLVSEVIEYADAEFAIKKDTADLNEAISKFRKEMYTAIIKQGDTLQDSVERLGSNLTGALALSISEMSKAIEESVNDASRFSEGLEKPLEMWKESIEKASNVQSKVNDAYNSLGTMVDGLNETSISLARNYDLYFERMQSQVGTFKDSIYDLVGGVNELKTLNQNNRVDYEAVSRELAYIDKNQEILEKSLQQYESALEGVTVQVGEALGSIIELQMQGSYDRLNIGLQDNIDVIIGTNNDLILKMQDLFEDMKDQMRTQTQTLSQVREQIDSTMDIITEKV